MVPLVRRLAFRVLAPLALFTLVLAVGAFGFALVVVSEFVATQAANDLRWRALGITQILETNYDELQRSGKARDEAAVRARKVIALMNVEDFARANDTHVRIDDAMDKRSDELGPELATATTVPFIDRWLGDPQRTTPQVLNFKPWEWTITLTQDTRAYQALFHKLLLLAGVATAVLVAGFAALTLWLTAMMRRPIRHIVADLEQNRPPHYAGIAEFEFLSGSIAAMMRTSQQADAERQARLVAESANLAKSQFLAAMSHELRTPLNAILGFAQVLQIATNLTPRQREQLKTMQESGEHLLTLIEDVLDLAKIEAGKLSLELAVVETDAFLQTVRDICRNRAEAKRITFAFERAPSVPRRVRVDERRLRQVLLNLIGNGIKFTERGKVTLRVQRVAQAGELARLRFEVQDTGVGIPADQHERIFHPFEQLGDIAQRAKGTGLGLAISRQLVQMMGGDIHVQSEPGAGSLFWFEIDVPAQLAPGAPAPLAKSVPVGYDGPRRKVLVVDDVAENRALLADMLRRFDFAVVEAADGRAGVEAAQASRPDLILMDSIMPVMDGIEATRRLRALQELQDVPVITLSAGATQDAAKSLEAGANGFLTKPLHLEALLREIEAQLKVTWVY